MNIAVHHIRLFWCKMFSWYERKGISWREMLEYRVQGIFGCKTFKSFNVGNLRF